MTTIYKYRIRCTTDSVYEFVWGENPPTKCPTNTAHTVDLNSITITDKIEIDEVVIKEENVPTGGNFQAMTLSLDIPANSTAYKPVHWPFNVTAFGVNFITNAAHKGDIIELYAGKNTTVGIILSSQAPISAWASGNYVAGDKVLYTHLVFGDRIYTCILDTVSNEEPTNTTYWRHGNALLVSSTVIDYVLIGYYIRLTDGVNADDVGRVISIDAESSIIYVENNLTNSYSPASPTYVQQTVYFIKDYEVGEDWERNIGEMKIGGSHIPADTFIEMSYKNNSVSDAKYIVGHVEYLY